MQLQQHGQLSAPRTWAFGLAESRNQRWHPPFGQGISGKIKKHQPRFMEKDLPLQKCWMLTNQAHVKSADFHILLLKSISTLVALGFQTMTVKHSTQLQVVMAKRQNMQVKQVNSLLMFLPSWIMLYPSKEQRQGPGRLCLLLNPPGYMPQ